jgi:hypothetical protein
VEAFRDPVAAAEAGVGWERILFYWSELQPAGPEDWNGYHVPDEWLDLAADEGRQVVGLVKHTPAWATDGPPGCGVPSHLDLPVDDSGNLWAALVRRLVQIYAGRVDRWVIWNEPDIEPNAFGSEWCGSMEEYYRLLKVAYLAAHQANPDVKIHLAGATTWHNPAYFRDFLDVAVQDPEASEHGYFFDVISLHIYFRTETIPEILRATQATQAARGLEKPIWINETNAPSNLDTPYWELPDANFDISLEEQASFLLQSFALSLSSGAERVAVYKWVDGEPQPGVEPFGVMRADYSRRPAYDAYRLITENYAGAVSAREDRHPLHTVVTLDRGDLVTRVIWARTEAGAVVSLSALAPQALLTDQTGGEQQLEAVDGQYAISLPGARCADRRGCIVGGPTYMLVEETSGASLPTATTVPVPLETPVVTPTIATATAMATPEPSSPSPTPTLVPTGTPTPTATPSFTPSATATPTRLPTPTPTPSSTPTSRPSASPPPSATPAPPSPVPTAMPALALPLNISARSVGFAVLSLVASVAIVGVWLRRVGSQ